MDDQHELCQILVVSSSQAVGVNVVNRIISHRRDASAQPLIPDDEGRIPWTISNKYYTAPVYFQVQKLSLPPAKPLWPPEVDDVHAPAVVYAFDTRELNKDLFKSLVPAFDAHSAEVRLAVGLGNSDLSSNIATRYEIDGQEDDALEVFFTGHEFEYVNVDTPVPPTDESSLRYDVTGLPRVIDALSTIMWPSMVRKPSTRKSLNLAILSEEGMDDDFDGDIAAFDPDFMVQPLGDSGIRTSLPDSFEGRLALEPHHVAAQSETAALEAWLDEDQRNGIPDAKDDDFSDFIAAPVPSGSSEPRTSVEWPASPRSVKEPPLGQTGDDASYVALDDPKHDPASYAALDDLEDDEELPSEIEVVQTHARIFGPPRPPEPVAAEADTDFDLTSALGALQAMREEIRGMTDEKERRRAAARVALGLVHGLGLEGGEEAEMEDVMAGIGP